MNRLMMRSCFLFVLYAIAVSSLGPGISRGEKPLYDTPQHLMLKAIQTDVLLESKAWKFNCSRWTFEGEAVYSTTCRIRRTQRGRQNHHFYRGIGSVILRRKGPFAWYWTFSYKIEERSPGCRAVNPDYAAELAEVEADAKLGITDPAPERVLDCSHYVYKREWSPERLIHLH